MQIKNSLNEMPLKDYKAIEMNLYFFVLDKLAKDVSSGTTKEIFSYDELVEGASSNKMVHEIKKDIESFALKSQKLFSFGEDQLPYPLFNKFSADSNNQIVEVEISPALVNLFVMDREWTSFSLKELAAIKTKYGKTLYRLLKQYQTVGKRSFSIDDYRRLMGISDTYRTYDVKRVMIDSATKEILPYFSNLSYSIERHGWKISGVTFTFDSKKKLLLQQKGDEK